MAAENPKFNTFTPYTHTKAINQDYYLLDLKNDTKNADWNDPISADAGDILTFSVYYHNAVNETAAHNTTIRIVIPSAQGMQIISTAYLWADNAENATYSNPLTENGIVNISSLQKLEYISGSAKWYPNQADWRLDAPTSFLFGQTGDEIIGSGVNIGDVNGCWEFSGYINFKVKVSSIIPQGQVLGTTTPPQQGQVLGAVTAVTGADDIFVSAAAATAASAATLFVLYFALANLNWFTRLRLNGHSYYIRFKEN